MNNLLIEVPNDLVTKIPLDMIKEISVLEDNLVTITTKEELPPLLKDYLIKPLTYQFDNAILKLH